MKGSAVAVRQAAAHERAAVESSLDEFARLVAAVGASVVSRVLQERDKPGPALFIGRGRAERLARTLADASHDEERAS